jgi:V/A-type H+-transporting ATPase subunit G/H
MEEKVEEVKVHREAVEKSSPLYLIREKELEINTRLLKAKKQAEVIIQKAREEAARIKEKGVSEGQKEARKIGEKELAEARAEAERIQAEAISQARAIRQQKKGRKEAIEFLLKVTLPF